MQSGFRQEMTSSQNELFVLQAVNRQGFVTIPLFIYLFFPMIVPLCCFMIACLKYGDG